MNSLDFYAEIKGLLDASDASPEAKQEALSIGMSVCAPIAAAQGSNPAAAFGDGQFLMLLMQLLKEFLPILLTMLAAKEG